MTEIIKEMKNYMTEPIEGMSYAEKDKEGNVWIHCPWCGKKQFPVNMIRKLVICSINANRQTAKKCLK
jgi:hypothetical protein